MPNPRLFPVFALIFLLVACSAHGSEGSAPPPSDPVLPTFAPDGPGRITLVSRLSGEFVVEGPCLYLTEYSSGTTWLPIFQDGSAFWETSVLILDGQTVQPGRAVVVGAGTVDIETLPLAQEPHASCDTRNTKRVTAWP
jgi:hypothetical protein